MKQALPLIFVGVLGVGAGYLLHGQPPQPAKVSEQAKAQAIQAGMSQAPVGKVVHTFEDEAKLKEFAALWQQHQAHMLRSALLEDYWNSEQAHLTQLNNQLNSQYGLDAEKSYLLNPDRKVILERETPPPGTETVPPTAGAAAGKAPATPAGAPAAAAKEEKVVHTFTDDAAMQGFATLWQERQGSLVRMAVLKSYWESEKDALSKLNAKLVSDYQMDATKQYTINEQQRTLIEREAPPAAPVASAGSQPAQAQTQPTPPAGQSSAAPAAQGQPQAQ